jgi:hypothetical protein
MADPYEISQNIDDTDWEIKTGDLAVARDVARFAIYSVSSFSTSSSDRPAWLIIANCKERFNVRE